MEHHPFSEAVAPSGLYGSRARDWRPKGCTRKRVVGRWQHGEPLNTVPQRSKPSGVGTPFSGAATRFVRKGLEGFSRGTKQRGVERPERVSAEPRKARSVLAPDAPK
jgi:hypothetical protein